MNLSKERAKILLLATNIVNFLIGCTILGFGIYLAMLLDSHPYGTSGYPTALVAVFIAMGCISTILSVIIGYKAKTKPTRKLTNFYYFLMFVLLVSQITLVSLNYKWKYTASCDVKKTLNNYLQTYDEKNSAKWDKFQIKHHCCGVKGNFQLSPEIRNKFIMETRQRLLAQEKLKNPLDLDCKAYADKKYKKVCKWEKDKKGKEQSWNATKFIGDETYKRECNTEAQLNYKAEQSGYKNWENATNWQKTLKFKEYHPKSVPDSCCKIPGIKDCGKYIVNSLGNGTWSEKINKKGCFYKFYKDVKFDIGIGHIAGIVLFILELISVFVACRLLKVIDPPRH